MNVSQCKEYGVQVGVVYLAKQLRQNGRKLLGLMESTMKTFSTIAVSLLLSFSGSSFAHHSSAPHFDESVEIRLEGTVTEWRFVNPHSYIYFDVVGENGEKVNWRCEMHAKTPMQRSGFSEETFFEGQKLTLVGAPARREDNVCGLTSFIFSDGTEVGRAGTLPEKYRIGAPLESNAPVAEVARPEYLENGQPNISGYWVRAGRGGPPAGAGPAAGEGAAGSAGARPEGGPPAAGGERTAGGPTGQRGGRGRGAQYDLTELALAEQANYEQIYDNPSISCDITNIFFGWSHDSNVNQITQEDDKITLLYGYMDYVRTIHLDMDEHPDNIVASRVGHSIGRWEGKTLVVDTIGFTAGVFNPLSGEPYGTEMHSVEKFSYDAEAKTLNRSYVATDPDYLNTPYAAQDSMSISDIAYEPYNCIELSGDNNRRPSKDSGN